MDPKGGGAATAPVPGEVGAAGPMATSAVARAAPVRRAPRVVTGPVPAIGGAAKADVSALPPAAARAAGVRLP